MTDDDDSKSVALAKHRSFHPRPERVSHELFHTSEFFDPRDLLQVKYEMLRRVREDEQPISRAATEAGLSRPTYYKAQEAFERVGLAGLLPVKKGPRRAHKLTDEVIDFVVGQVEAEPALGGDDLVLRIHEQFDITVHRRSLERAMQRRRRKRGL